MTKKWTSILLRRPMRQFCDVPCTGKHRTGPSTNHKISSSLAVRPDIRWDQNGQPARVPAEGNLSSGQDPLSRSASVHALQLLTDVPCESLPSVHQGDDTDPAEGQTADGDRRASGRSTATVVLERREGVSTAAAKHDMEVLQASPAPLQPLLQRMLFE